MKSQVMAMFGRQYGIGESEFSVLLDQFYDHPYQKDKSIRIAALDGTKVVGFQSFFYWPYMLRNQEIKAFQSGNSLVHHEYRGQQIFARLLEYLDVHREEFGIQLLVGFPINASLNSLLRNGWKNIVDLQWQVCRGSLLSVLGNEQNGLKKCFSTGPSGHFRDHAEQFVRLSTDEAFAGWRRNYSAHQPYYYFTHEAGGETTEFTLKASRRKRVIRELIIGDVRTTTFEKDHMADAFKRLVTVVRQHHAATIISFASNLQNHAFDQSMMARCGFNTISRKIFFCIKNFSAPEEVLQPGSWMLYRSDIDTW
jgi:hypothetical protein